VLVNYAKTIRDVPHFTGGNLHELHRALHAFG